MSLHRQTDLIFRPPSDQRDQARLAVEEAKQTAEQFVKDFGGLEGA